MRFDHLENHIPWMVPDPPRVNRLTKSTPLPLTEVPNAFAIVYSPGNH